MPVNDIEQFQRQKAGDDIKRIYQALVVNAEVKKLPEATFVKEILPILTGTDINTDFPLLISAVAGSPFSELDIVNDAGETIFRMPSLLERNIISHEEATKRGSLSSVFITVEQLARNSPRRAAHYLAHEFHHRGISNNVNNIEQDRIVRWNKILERYGKQLRNGVIVDIGQVSEKATVIKNRPQLDFDDNDLI